MGNNITNRNNAGRKIHRGVLLDGLYSAPRTENRTIAVRRYLDENPYTRECKPLAETISRL